jgi:hypothetical protein
MGKTPAKKKGCVVLLLASFLPLQESQKTTVLGMRCNKSYNDVASAYDVKRKEHTKITSIEVSTDSNKEVSLASLPLFEG